MMGRLEQGLGMLLILIILLDIFLTVLYARINTSIIGSRVGRLVWASFVTASKVFGTRQGAVLSFCGPVILVLLVRGLGSRADAWGGVDHAPGTRHVHPRHERRDA